MDKRYELFCLKDQVFYDALDATNTVGFAIAAEPLPPGWQQTMLNEWIVYVPPENRIPAQGWKIHVSACRQNAAEVLGVIRDYCVPREISFKHLNGPTDLFLRNAKYAPRGASGKLVTVYPADNAELARVIDDLAPRLAGQPGPYILSDLRIGDGPLYVRYGAFTERRRPDEHGKLVSVIEDPDGNLVPDRRDPIFYVPPWVDLPDFLGLHLAARNAITTVDLPYQVKKPLHFSNGGGVYEAVDTRTGEQVVLKEARPYAGLAADGSDAVARLHSERAILEKLAGIEGIPAVRDYFVLGDHHFLVEEFIEGRPLNDLYALRHPLLDPEPSAEQVAGYTAWALKVSEGVERITAAVHERGVVINDLHMFNIMVRPDDTVALIDFEIACSAEEAGRQSLANPGFLAPPDRRGIAVDNYSLACLRLALFMPLTTLFVLDRTKAWHLAEVIAENFPVQPSFLPPAVEEITRGAPGGPALPRFTADREGWELARTTLSQAIRASATPHRDDRLFPGDIEQFASGGLGLAHGAAGVLYALDATGCGRCEDHEQWLIDHATEPRRSVGLGLYDGLLGAAYTLGRLGHRDAALEVAGIVLAEKWQALGPDLFGGLTGLALALDYLADATGEAVLAETAARAAELVVDWVTESDKPPTHPGLLNGASGPALLCVRRFEATEDERWLDHAAWALRRDLAACVIDKAGALHVDVGSRVLPYLARGSTGIGMVIDEYLRHRDDLSFSQAREAIRRAGYSRYYGQSGLFSGRAGILTGLARTDRTSPIVADHVRDFSWYALSYGGGIAFPGDYLMRLSMDLATGTAGVLLALGSVLHDSPVNLPFLGPDLDVLRSTRTSTGVLAETGAATEGR